MTVSVVKPHNVGNVSLVPMRKYALIGRPMHVFIDVYFKSEGSSLMASKNEYALSYIGQSIGDLADFVPSSTLGSQWKFETLKVTSQSGVVVHLFYDDGKVYFCTDASKVDYIEFHTLDPGEVADIRSIDEINESSMVVLPSPTPSGITLSPTPIASSSQSNTVLYPLSGFNDAVTFHVILHEGTWTKMTFLPKIASNNTTYPILIGIFNIKGNIPNAGTGFDNHFSIERYGTTGNLYPPNNTIDNVQWVDVNVDPNSPNYYKVTTDIYCEFDVVVKNTGNIRKVVPPAIYSFWNIGQFANLSLHTFTMRGHVFRTISQNNGQCGCRQFAGVSIKMPSYNFGCGCVDGLRVTFTNSSNLKEFHITTGDAVGVPGESCVFDIGDSSSPKLPATIQYFNAVGTYWHPLYGVSGNLSVFSNFGGLIQLRAPFTSIHGDVYDLRLNHFLQTINLNNCDVYGDLSSLPESCKEFRAYGHPTPFTWSVTNRCARVYTYLDSGVMAQISSFAVSIPQQIEMSTLADVQRMLTDISNSVAISNGSIHLIVKDSSLSDSVFASGWSSLVAFCADATLKGKLYNRGILVVEISGRYNSQIININTNGNQ